MTRSTRALLRSLAAMTLVLAAGACGDDDETTVDDITEPSGILPEMEDTGVDDADEFVGQEVTVTGEVSAQINDRTFHIGSEEGGDGLLVFSETPIVDELDADDVVRVTGTVREVDRETFDNDYGLLWNEDYEEFGTRHAVFATEVEIVSD